MPDGEPKVGGASAARRPACLVEVLFGLLGSELVTWTPKVC